LGGQAVADRTKFRGVPVRPIDVEATPVATPRPSAASELSMALGRYLNVVKNFSIAALRTSSMSSSDHMPGSVSVSMDRDDHSLAADSIPEASPAIGSTSGHNVRSSSLSAHSATSALSEDPLLSYSNDSSSSDSIASAWGVTSASTSMTSSVDPPFRIPYHRRFTPAYGRAPIASIRGLTFVADGNSSVTSISTVGPPNPLNTDTTRNGPSSGVGIVESRGIAVVPPKVSRVTIGGTTSQEDTQISEPGEVESTE
jgi:hypothetical protein